LLHNVRTLPLAIGSSLGAYEILAPLGAGGMGEVYRARDTRLGRDVAIKTLAAHVFGDGESLARFRREAQLLAALNHQNIATIHAIEEAGGTLFLVLELVDGEPLDRLVARGPLPVDRALEIARQVIAALDAAHEHGIVHRDLKPSNIALTRNGTVKVLDFGLARREERTAIPPANVVDSPTITAASPIHLTTGAGVLLGTAAYMSPEQARGYPADRRSDIWAFGCILYEMLTGIRLFGAQTVTDSLAAVLTREPDWQRVPPRARRLLRQCLERDPQRRLRDIGDAALLLDEPLLSDVEGSALETRKRRTLPWIGTGASVTALAAAMIFLWPAPTDRQLVQLAINLGDSAPEYALVPAAISADGARLVYYARDENGQSLLATRRLDEEAPALLAGTANADQPFFSPDGEWIGFFSLGELRKVPVRGGTPIAIAEAGVARGASWGDDRSIVAALTNGGGLSVIPEDGGTPRSLTTLSRGEPTHRWPQVLPGSKAVIFTANSPTLNSYEDATIDVVSLESGERKTLWRGGYFGRYMPTRGGRGHLVYIRGGSLFAVPFDPARLEIQGTPMRIMDEVAADPGSAAGHFDFSRTGTFIVERGAGLLPWTISWLGADGKTAPLIVKPSLYYSPRVSPDGQRLAFGIDSGKGQDIYVHDRQRDVQVRLTYTGLPSADPVWARDGQHLVFRTYGASAALWWGRTDGTGQPVKIHDGQVGDLGPNSFSPDGRRLIYSGPGDGGDSDLWTITLDTSDVDHPMSGPPEPFFHSTGSETRPAFSPDRRWVAYQSNESGQLEIYVRAFVANGSRAGKWQVSSGGGDQPVWSRQGRELFFLAGDRMMVTEYQNVDGTFVATKPRVWATVPRVGNTGFSRYDVTPDGRRVVLLTRAQPEAGGQTPRMHLLLNFFDEIRRRSPAN
jgi:serine/threonine-protein kinase